MSDSSRRFSSSSTACGSCTITRPQSARVSDEASEQASERAMMMVRMAQANVEEVVELLARILDLQRPPAPVRILLLVVVVVVVCAQRAFVVRGHDRLVAKVALGLHLARFVDSLQQTS